MTNRLLFTASFVALSLASVQMAQADSITVIEDLPGGTVDIYPQGRNDDGGVLVGRSDSASGYEAFRWEEGTGIVGLGDLPGGIYDSGARGVSGDGNVVVGQGRSASGAEAFMWTAGGGMVGLGDLAGGIFWSRANAASSDGSIIVGGSYNALGEEAFRWTAGGGMVGLGDLAGGAYESEAYYVSSDGSVVAGFSNSANGYETFRWTAGGGMVALGDLAGGIYKNWIADMNDDGNVIVGDSNSASGDEGYIWTAGGGMAGLGDLAGGVYDSHAGAVSDDGTTVVGTSNSANGDEAFRWTAGDGMVGLGDLAGGAFESYALAVNSDGSVVGGWGTTGIGTSAFIWDSVNGMRELATILTDSGVDLSGWTDLSYVYCISDDGTRIIGGGDYLGDSLLFVASIGAVSGITTVDALESSLSEAQLSGQQAVSQMSLYTNRALFLARNALSYFPKVISPSSTSRHFSLPQFVEPAAGDGDGEDSTSSYHNSFFPQDKWAFYALGSYAIGHDNNPDSHELDGAAGVLYRPSEDWIIGGGAISGQTSINLRNGGENTLRSNGAEFLASYEGDEGVRLYMVGFASYLTLDSSRGYLNGSSTTYSYGETEGYGYGASARLGWNFDLPLENGTSVMPYAEIEYSKTSLDRYAETGGPFPASYSEQKGERLIGRLGAEFSHELLNDLTLRMRVAYARRLSDSEESVTASSSGVTMSLSPASQDDGWVESGVSVLFATDDNVHFSADLSGRSGHTEDPYLRATVGISIGF